VSETGPPRREPATKRLAKAAVVVVVLSRSISSSNSASNDHDDDDSNNNPLLQFQFQQSNAAHESSPYRPHLKTCQLIHTMHSILNIT
jgi:hypothetical protein